jgi:GT2 family glycosyltransferase
LLNNDAAAEPDWLERLVRDAEAHPEAALLASHMVFWSDPQRTENAGIVLFSTGEAVPRGRGRPRADFTAPARLLGACAGAALYRAEVLRELGLFRGDFFANFEDVDLSLRMLAAGHECRFVPGAVVRHRLNATVDRIRDDEFRIRSIRNMTHAYWSNVPWPVAVLNLPWHVFSWICVPPLAVLLGQWDLARILVRGRLRCLRELGAIRSERRRLRPHRRGNPLRIWWRQRSFLGGYLRFLWDVVLLRKRRYLE